ncbi:MAG TPA: alpha/beta hydrolase [Terriglobales bacterium]|nr:alpha/beta hydrolase [Terriglobales bacterium]
MRFPAPGRLVDIDGDRLHLYELGSGSPTVVLESGISASSLNWRRVQTEVAKFARVCSYDRSGLGWSELCDQPCTPSSLAEQLHSMLHVARIPQPYLLVGHSFGGLIVRAFAEKFQRETAGLVLVDPFDPAEWNPLSDEQRRTIADGIRLARRGALAARLGIVRFCLNLLLAGNRLVPRAAAKGWSGRASLVTERIATQVRKMPEETWPLVAFHWMQPKSFEAMARHFECLAQSIAEMQKAPALDLPVTMLIGVQNEHPTDQHEYAKRISRRTTVIFAQKSGHWIQLDEPRLVVNSIWEMLDTR